MKIKTKSKSKITIIVSAVLAVIASVSIYFLLIGNMVNVCIADKTVRTGTKITEAMISIKKVDKSFVPEDYISEENAKDLIGKYVNVDMTKGTVITSVNVASNSKASTIKEGYVAYSINELSTYPNDIEIGDKINVLCGTTLDGTGKVVVTFESIEVTNISYDSDNKVTAIEVEVTPEQAAKIAYAQLNGTLSLALLPNDYQNQNIPVVDENAIQ